MCVCVFAGLQSGFVTLPRLPRLDRQLPDSGGITLTRSDSLTSFTVDLGPSLMTEVLSLIDNPSCLQTSNHRLAQAGQEDEARGEGEEEEEDSSLSETPVQSPALTSPSSYTGRGRTCSSDGTEGEEERSSVRTPDSGSPPRAEPAMEAERFQRAADVLARHYGGGSFTQGARIRSTNTPARSHSCKTPYAFSDEEEEIKV